MAERNYAVGVRPYDNKGIADGIFETANGNKYAINITSGARRSSEAFKSAKDLAKVAIESGLIDAKKPFSILITPDKNRG